TTPPIRKAVLDHLLTYPLLLALQLDNLLMRVNQLIYPGLLQVTNIMVRYRAVPQGQPALVGRLERPKILDNNGRDMYIPGVSWLVTVLG
ncbi:MAG TPA: hypothetical protein VMN99_03305, partial [Anaerolineales bacterium]|nr:hypothetical protein [Anaerolineales bacterium]